MCEGASKQSSDLKNYTAPATRPPVHKFLDPPLHPLTVLSQNDVLLVRGSCNCSFNYRCYIQYLVKIGPVLSTRWATDDAQRMYPSLILHSDI